MSLDSDAIVDRRRLKRRLVLWRLVAVAIALVMVAVVAWREGAFVVGARVAELKLNGVLFDDPERIQAIEQLGRDSSVKAVIVSIDSPGGTVIAGENLYKALRAVAADKPVVAVIEGTGASAGYLVALAADRIIAHETSITGSIGVLIQTAEISQLLAKLGISAETIKSAPLKDAGNPLEPLTAAGRAATQAVVDDTYRWFVNIFSERRQLPPATALQLADGRVFTGRQAALINLIDGTGGLAEARQWLEETKDVPKTLPMTAVSVGRGFAGTDLLGLARKTLLSETLRIDGLVSLWQPEALR